MVLRPRVMIFKLLENQSKIFIWTHEANHLGRLLHAQTYIQTPFP